MNAGLFIWIKFNYKFFTFMYCNKIKKNVLGLHGIKAVNDGK